MSRQLDNLRRLFRKLQAHYGDHDAIVLQVKHELDSREGVESGYQHGPIPYRDAYRVMPPSAVGTSFHDTHLGRQVPSSRFRDAEKSYAVGHRQ